MQVFAELALFTSLGAGVSTREHLHLDPVPELSLGGLLRLSFQEVPPVSEGVSIAGDQAGRDPFRGLHYRGL